MPTLATDLVRVAMSDEISRLEEAFILEGSKRREEVSRLKEASTLENTKRLEEAQRLKEETLANKRKVLEEHMRAQSNHKETYVTEAFSKDLWKKRDVYRVFPSYTSSQLSSIRERSHVILTILTYIAWPLDSYVFARHFLDTEGPAITDEELPYDGNLDFLGPQKGLFRENQLIFKPCVILTETSNLIKYKARRPFPFLEHKSISQGTGGEVSRAEIAPSYLTNGKGTCNTKPTLVAYKKFKQAGDREIENQLFIRQSISNHDHVQLHLSAIMRGNELYIFMRWTPLGDLEILLHGGHDPAAEGTSLGKSKYSFESQFKDFTEINFIMQLRNLANALKFLHFDLITTDTSAQRYYCAHNDLRPRNILIYPDPASPIGKWMIADFGISSFGHPQESDSGPKSFRYPTIGDLAPLPEREGTHFAPERHERSPRVADPRKCDVWSFGCICTDVLAFVIGGLGYAPNQAVKQAVKSLKKFRNDKIGLDDYFYQNPDGVGKYDLNAVDAELRLEVSDWLDRWDFQYRVRTPRVHDWVFAMTKLIRAMLVVNPKDRLDAKRVFAHLARIPNAMQPGNPGTLSRATTFMTLPVSESRVHSWALSESSQQTDESEQWSGLNTPERFGTPVPLRGTLNRLQTPGSTARVSETMPLSEALPVASRIARGGESYTPLSTTQTVSQDAGMMPVASESQPVLRTERIPSSGSNSLRTLGSVTPSARIEVSETKLFGSELGHAKNYALSPAADKVAYLFHNSIRQKNWYIKVYDIKHYSSLHGSTTLAPLPNEVCWEKRETELRIAAGFLTVSGLVKGGAREFFWTALQEYGWQRYLCSPDTERPTAIVPSTTGRFAVMFRHTIKTFEYGKPGFRSLPTYQSTLCDACWTGNGRYLISLWWKPGGVDEIIYTVGFWDIGDAHRKPGWTSFLADAKRGDKKSLLPAASLPACMLRIEESQSYAYIRAPWAESLRTEDQHVPVPRTLVYDSLPTTLTDSFRASIVRKRRKWGWNYEVHLAYHDGIDSFELDSLLLHSVPNDSFEIAAVDSGDHNSTLLALVNAQGQLIHLQLSNSSPGSASDRGGPTVAAVDFAPPASG